MLPIFPSIVRYDELKRACNNDALAKTGHAVGTPNSSRSSLWSMSIHVSIPVVGRACIQLIRDNKMTYRAKTSTGFSLLELVIVIVIMGIVAAVAIPRMSRGSAGAADAALSGDLSVLRRAIRCNSILRIIHRF